MTESPEINSHTDSHLIYEKGGKIIQWRKDKLFNKLLWKNWPGINTHKRTKSEHSLTSYAKNISIWIKDLKVWLDTIKLLEKTIGRTLFDINCSRIFNLPPRVMRIRTKINKWDLIKHKALAQQRKP